MAEAPPTWTADSFAFASSILIGVVHYLYARDCDVDRLRKMLAIVDQQNEARLQTEMGKLLAARSVESAHSALLRSLGEPPERPPRGEP